VTLIPFFVFSIFHTLTYLRSHLLPLLFTSTEKTPDIIRQLDLKIQQFTDNYHTSAMHYVAYIEVIGILGRLLFGILT
jgi:hypothetical protein